MKLVVPLAPNCVLIVLQVKSVEVVIVACFPFNAVCNPSVLAIVELPSVMVACFVFSAVITFVEPTNKVPVTIKSV
jgi:hypothetical protein